MAIHEPFPYLEGLYGFSVSKTLNLGVLRAVMSLDPLDMEVALARIERKGYGCTLHNIDPAKDYSYDTDDYPHAVYVNIAVRIPHKQRPAELIEVVDSIIEDNDRARSEQRRKHTLAKLADLENQKSKITSEMNELILELER